MLTQGAAPAIGDYEDPQITYAVEVKKTNGGQRWKATSKANGEEAVTGATMKVSVYISGRTPGECGLYADTWERRLRSMTRYYVGARFVSVLGVTASPRQKAGRAMLNRTLTVTAELLDDLWRLSDDDVRGLRYPSEQTPGEYPYGLLHVLEGNTVEPLGGVSFSDSTFTFSGANGQTFTLPTTRATYD